MMWRLFFIFCLFLAACSAASETDHSLDNEPAAASDDAGNEPVNSEPGSSVPGNSEGAWVEDPAKPGLKVGEKCQTNEECASEYCLPTRQICSKLCAQNSACPAGYRCSLEKIDQNKNGSLDNAQAVCVPQNKGGAQVGALCQTDENCLGNHCYDGFCMEACGQDSDCRTDQACASVHILLDAATPSYRGCLPRQGVSSYVIGTFSGAKAQAVDIPPGARSFVLTAEVASTSDIPVFRKVLDPTRQVLYQLDDACSFFSQPNRFMYEEQLSSLLVPNTPSVTLAPGIFNFQPDTNEEKPVTVTLHLKMGERQQGTVNINWFFLDLSGTCISGTPLNATTAKAGHQWMKSVRADLSTILAKMNLAIGQENFADIKNAALNTIDLSGEGNSSELQQLFATSSSVATGRAINIFFVRQLKSGGASGAEILGISGGIPGPMYKHGTVHSGIAISMATACYQKYGYNPGHTLAHEMGHYLGLFHNQEADENPGYEGGAVVCPCPCGANMGCTKMGGQSWCRGEDPIADTTTSSANLMYFAAENTDINGGNQVTTGQTIVVLNNPWVD